MLMFIIVFVLPFLLPLICVGVLSTVRRERLIIAAGILTLVGVLAAAPLAYVVVASPYPEGLALASLTLYPASLVAVVGTLLTRALIAWFKGRAAGAADRAP